ncbi:OmpA family protein [Shewanella corallii]|uniref:OmpA family protein n=1 Tax=Shewanella corallii TaxID=560080 RepID=A0ABT0N4H8_9GAMM|nr:OmpA family protein [Shewanella corallii]MCL2913368.1 OmpA family protein [Shewanella corallii]
MMNRMLSVALLSALIPASLAANAKDDDGLSPWYIGAGVGVNDYEYNFPDKINQEDDPYAWEAFVGYQMSEHYAFEVGYRNLGRATWVDWSNNQNDAGARGLSLSLVGTIPIYGDFHAIAEAGAMHYTLKNNRNWGANQYSDSGWSPYAGLGLGYYITDNIQLAAKYRRYGNLEDDRYNTLDMDSNYWGATIAYRFGSASKPAPTPPPVVEEVVITDADQDGVPDRVDQCPDTPAEYMVDSNGCTVFEETVQNLHIDAKFANNSAELDKSSMDEVAMLAEFMKQNPKSTVLIKGFASNTGNPDYNMQLSQRRAESVARALETEFGIAASRISARGYGITQPLIPGTSKEANEANRRIEADVTVVDMVPTSR